MFHSLVQQTKHRDGVGVGARSSLRSAFTSYPSTGELPYCGMESLISIRRNGANRVNDTAADFTRAWSERRGIESIDRNAEVLLVRTSLNQLWDVLAGSTIESCRDVLGSEMEISGYFGFSYQIVRQAWSILVTDAFIHAFIRSGSVAVSMPSAADLSKQLGEPVIKLNISDTSCMIGYALFEGGEIVEYFAGSEDESTDWCNEYGLSDQRLVVSPYPDDDPEAKQVVYFWSRRRQLTAKEIGNMLNFADRFIRELDAYDPGISARYFLGQCDLRYASRYKIQNPGFTLMLSFGQEVKSLPDLVRVDYFRFGN